MPITDFDKIILTKEEKKFLKRLKKHRALPLPESMQHLYMIDFVSPCYSDQIDGFGHPIPNGNYELSDIYYRYHEYTVKQTIRALPNWIAIIIAFLSLAVSIVSLVFSIIK